ncbi:MAG: hypothetical protein ABGW90_11290, partial [Martelella sp.]
ALVPSIATRRHFDPEAGLHDTIRFARPFEPAAPLFAGFGGDRVPGRASDHLFRCATEPSGPLREIK